VGAEDQVEPGGPGFGGVGGGGGDFAYAAGDWFPGAADVAFFSVGIIHAGHEHFTILE